MSTSPPSGGRASHSLVEMLLAPNMLRDVHTLLGRVRGLLDLVVQESSPHSHRRASDDYLLMPQFVCGRYQEISTVAFQQRNKHEGKGRVKSKERASDRRSGW